MGEKRTRKRVKATNHKKKLSCTSEAADLGPHKLNLLHAVSAVSSVEGVRNCASRMDKNLIRIQHVRLRSEGFLSELR